MRLFSHKASDHGVARHAICRRVELIRRPSIANTDAQCAASVLFSIALIICLLTAVHPRPVSFVLCPVPYTCVRRLSNTNPSARMCTIRPRPQGLDDLSLRSFALLVCENISSHVNHILLARAQVCSGAPEYLPVLPGVSMHADTSYFHHDNQQSAPSSLPAGSAASSSSSSSSSGGDDQPDASNPHRATLDAPLVPGYAVSGEVDAIGDAIQHVNIGDNVVALLSLAQVGLPCQYVHALLVMTTIDPLSLRRVYSHMFP